MEQPRQPRIGVIMLDTAFPRPVGDIGNPASFAGGVDYEKVSAATLERIVLAESDDFSMMDGFVAARDRLVEGGAEIITTSCGLLVFYQKRLQQDCHVPFTASALFQIPLRLAQLGGPIGVIGLQASGITPAHLVAAGAPAETPVVGLPEDGHLLSVLRANAPDVGADPDRAAEELMAAALDLVATVPGLRGIVLECTNLPPYRAALDTALDIPFFDYQDWLASIANKEAAPDGAPMTKAPSLRKHL